MKKFLSVLMILNIFSLHSDLISSEELWQSFWFKAAEYSSKGDVDKSIESYSKTIEELIKNGITKPNIYYERGLVFIKKHEYKKAFQDFTFVIESKEASVVDKSCALNLRAQMHLLLGNPKECEKDCIQSLTLDPIQNIVEGKNFASFRLNSATRLNKELLEAIKQGFLLSQIIKTEDEMFILPSGYVILKKSASCPADVLKKYSLNIVN